MRITKQSSILLSTTAIMQFLFLAILLVGTYGSLQSNTFLNAVFELIWIPTLLFLFATPILLGLLIYKQKFKNKNIPTLLIATSLICIILLFTLN